MSSSDFLTTHQPHYIFGCEQLGAYEWGNVDVNAIENAIIHAVERGKTVFDTADCYGNGLSEKRLGKALRGKRDKAFLATKFGVRLTKNGVRYDSSPEWIIKAIDGSLSRLCTDYIDLYQMHYWDGTTHLEDTIEQLEKLKKQGKIRAYGFTNVAQLPSTLKRTLNFLTMSLEYSLANRTHEDNIVKLCDKGFTFLSYGSLGQGVLSGKYNHTTAFDKNDRRSRKEYKNFHGDNFEKNLEIVSELTTWSKRLDVSPPLLALKWISRKIPCSIPIVGIKNQTQLDLACKLDSFQLPDDALESLTNVSSTTCEKV